MNLASISTCLVSLYLKRMLRTLSRLRRVLVTQSFEPSNARVAPGPNSTPALMRKFLMASSLPSPPEDAALEPPPPKGLPESPESPTAALKPIMRMTVEVGSGKSRVSIDATLLSIALRTTMVSFSMSYWKPACCVTQSSICPRERSRRVRTTGLASAALSPNRTMFTPFFASLDLSYSTERMERVLIACASVTPGAGKLTLGIMMSESFLSMTESALAPPLSTVGPV